MEHKPCLNSKRKISPQENDAMIDGTIVTQKTLEDIKTIVKYLWKDEQKHYYEANTTDRQNHIFLYLKRLKSCFKIKT